jgi:hypothetical protein
MDVRRPKSVVIDERLAMSPFLMLRIVHIDTDAEFSKFRLTNTDKRFPITAHFASHACEIDGDV